MKHRVLLSLGVVVAALTVSLSSVSAKSVKPVLDKKEYNDFFKLLSPEEKEWLMNLAVWYYDADKPHIGPFPTDQIGMFGVKPIPSNSTMGQDIPNTLVFQFLNGDIPKDWAKEFTKWLTREYGLQEKNYEQYKSTGVFCTPQDKHCDLVDLYNVGGICCPFG